MALGAGLFAAGGTALYLDENDSAGFDSSPTGVSAQAGEATYELAPFDEISSSGPQDIVVTYGEAISVRSEGSPEALEQIEVFVEDGVITIRQNDDLFDGNWGTLESATFHITLPQLDRITLAGSGDIQVDRIEGQSFEGTISGSGEIKLAQMDVQEANLSVFGSGDLTVAGTSGETTVTIAGSGKVRGDDLRSETASVNVGGSGNAALTVDTEAEVAVAGSGNVDIYGPAQCAITQFGSGNVNCSQGSDDQG